MQHIRDWKTFPLTDEYKKILEEYAKTHEIESHSTSIIDWSDPEQKKEIKVEPFSENDFAYYPYDWNVEETFDTFNISTMMDNYNMRQYLESIGINIEKCGIVIRDGHYDVFGLNDFKTDMRDYLDDPDFYSNYDDYWYSSKEYRENFYPKWVQDKEPFNINQAPRKKKKWICEDAERALNEFGAKLNEFAIKNGYINWLDKEAHFTIKNDIPNIEIFRGIFNILEEVKENWQAVDDFEEPQVYTAPLDLNRWNNQKEDESQLVIANLEGEGYFNESDEKAYTESIDKLYKPIGINIKDLAAEDC